MVTSIELFEILNILVSAAMWIIPNFFTCYFCQNCFHVFLNKYQTQKFYAHYQKFNERNNIENFDSVGYIGPKISLLKVAKANSEENGLAALFLMKAPKVPLSEPNLPTNSDSSLSNRKKFPYHHLKLKLQPNVISHMLQCTFLPAPEKEFPCKFLSSIK